MGFFSNLIGAAVDVIATPVRVVQDVFDPEPESRTVKGLDDAVEKVAKAFGED